MEPERKAVGESPIQASSRRNVRHRLNPHGDRALNRALHHIALTLERCDPRTKDYLTRRTREGKTRREAIRCLKRYLACKIYRALENGPHPPPTPLDKHRSVTRDGRLTSRRHAL